MPVHSVGKVGQLFAGVGIDVQHPGATNAVALAATGELIASWSTGSCSPTWSRPTRCTGTATTSRGSRARCGEIDAHVARWLALLGDDDMLVLTADHGCDVTAPHTDHTREYAPLLAALRGHGSRRHDGPLADVGASVLTWLAGATRRVSRRLVRLSASVDVVRIRLNVSAA